MTSDWFMLSAAGASFTLGSVLLKQLADTGSVLGAVLFERLAMLQLAGLGLAIASISLFAQTR